MRIKTENPKQEMSSFEEKIRKSALPQLVKAHLIGFARKGKQHSWQTVMEQHFDGVVHSAQRVFELAEKNTGDPIDELLKKTDLSLNDLDPDRLDAAIAELRAINFLAAQGFTGIQLLKARIGQKSADIVANKDYVRFAVDVACMSRSAPADIAKLKRKAESIFLSKREQLRATKATSDCSKIAIVFVVNSQPALALEHHRTFRDALREVHDALGAPPEAHICIVTGQVAHVFRGGESWVGSDDVVFPNW